MADELIQHPAWKLAQMVQQAQVSPVEVVRACYCHIEQVNPVLNAFVDLREEQALSEARALEARISRGEEVGPLSGVPVSIKSCIDVAGMKCEAGSRLRAGNIAKQDAPLVSRLKQAGAVVLGVTNTPEFLMAYETDNLLYGRTSNPWNLECSSGGSSGGEAASIAACMSAAGVGSDGGGSIRVPAHFTGICGLKPTPGVIPSTGHFPAGVGPFALTGVVGPMGRTVKDLRLMFSAMAGADSGDPMAAPFQLPSPDEEALRNLNVGWFDDDGLHPVTKETQQAVRLAAHALSGLGFTVEEFRPESLERARELWQTIFCRFSGLAFAPLVAGREDELSFFMRDLRRLQQREKALSAEDVLFTQFERDTLRERFLRQLETHPVLLLPVCTGPAFCHGAIGWTKEERFSTFLDTMVYSQWLNLLGFPAAVVPVGESSQGMPIGVQVAGRPYEDSTVLAVAELLEGSLQRKQTASLNRGVAAVAVKS